MNEGNLFQWVVLPWIYSGSKIDSYSNVKRSVALVLRNFGQLWTIVNSNYNE